jgi:sugar phosphate permease
VGLRHAGDRLLAFRRHSRFLLLRERPELIGAHPDGADGPPPVSDQPNAEGVSFADALRSPALYLLGLGSACLWYSIQAMNSQVTIFFEQDAGLAPARATLLFSVIFWFSFAGKFLFGLLSDKLAKRRVMLLSALTLLAGCLSLFEFGTDGLALTTSLPRLGLFAVVFGLGFGGSFTMIQLVAVETFGARSLGKILGIITLIDSLGAAAGTVITGQLKTSTGNYLLPFGLLTAVALIAVINVLFIRPVVPGNRRPAPP